MTILLPDDIYFDIFRVYIDSTEFKTNAALSVSHCCRQWRYCALNTAKLWNTIQIRRPHPKYLNRVRAWIERSRKYPLVIEVDNPLAHVYIPFVIHLQRCLDILTPHLSRWRSFRIRTTKPAELANICQMLQPLHLPELSTISLLTSDQHHSIPLAREYASAFFLEGEFPALQRLEVSSYWFKWIVWSRMSVAKLNLRSFSIRHTQATISSIGFRDCLAVLQECPSLKEFIIDTPIIPLPPQDENPQFYNPHSEKICTAGFIKYIQFRTTGDRSLNHSIISFLVHLQAPNLISFGENIIPVYFLPYLIALHTFPFPSLQIVRLALPPNDPDIDLLSENITQFLSHLTKLRHLEFHDARFRDLGNGSPDLLKSVKSAVKTICPSVETVTLKSTPQMSEKRVSTPETSLLPLELPEWDWELEN